MRSLQGDPKIYLTPDGATMNFIGGQPDMDIGFENQVLLALFTRRGWAGNTLFSDPAQQVGSDFEQSVSGAITLQKLSAIKQAAERALRAPQFGTVEATVANPVNNQIRVTIAITPPGRDRIELELVKNGINWIGQATQR